MPSADEFSVRFGLELLDSIPHAIFALDAAARILFMNRRAERLVERGDGFVQQDGALKCRSGAQQPLFNRLIAAALASDGEVRGGWARVDRSSGRRPYLMLVSRFTPSEDLLHECEPRILVIVSDPDEAAAPQAQALRQLYGLSETESRLATALAGGHSIQSAAHCLGMSPETARFHLKHIFRKLEVSRQQDLVRLLTEIAMVGGGAPAA